MVEVRWDACAFMAIAKFSIFVSYTILGHQKTLTQVHMHFLNLTIVVYLKG